MNAVASSARDSSPGFGRLVRFGIPLLALIAVIASSYTDAAMHLWQREDQTYAPLLAGLAFCLLGFRAVAIVPKATSTSSFTGFVLCAFGVMLYVVGRSQQIELAELTACIVLIAAVVLVLGGFSALRALGFPILFLFFSLPYPGWLIDSLTSPLKELISSGAEQLLYRAGYPISRSGVVLVLGPYRLLVADACSGLHSLIFLSALGSLYIHLTGSRRRLHVLALLTALVPIAVFANFVRVLILLLLTYYYGDSVAQGYWHNFAGVVLFVTAFALLLGLDHLLSGFGPHQLHEPVSVSSLAKKAPVTLPTWRSSLALGLLLLSATAFASRLSPGKMFAEQRPAINLESQIPQRLGEWITDDRADLLSIPADLKDSELRLYGQTLTRTYVNRNGRSIMLSIAYGSKQFGNELQAHRPEFCYKAQGFTLAEVSDIEIASVDGQIPARRLVARKHNRNEPITYWMTVGEIAVRPGTLRKLAQLRYGLSGYIPDGMLIRVSSLNDDSAEAFRLHESFISELVHALPKSAGMVFAQAPGAESFK